MYITFRDDLGLSLVKVDEHGIGFADDMAYFSDGIQEHKIPINNICEIRNNNIDN